MRPNYTLAGRYRILHPLGEGGMADVYLAHDLILDRDVSVKLLRLDLRDDPSTLRRFQREAMAASELVSPHIVSVYDVGEDNGMQYLVMEYVPGMDLKAYIKKNYPIAQATVVELMTQILQAVKVAHEHGIIHRDLKPQNVLVSEDGQIKISDFGIAVISNESTMTQTNTVLGSVHYLSPEQARGGMATKQSDIYSLGIILYELLTGKVPFEGETAVSVALKHSQNQMPFLRDQDASIPQPLENVVLRATAKNPRDRYASATAMAADLETVLSPTRSGETRFTPASLDDDATKVIPVADIRAANDALMEDNTSRVKGSTAVVDDQRKTKHHRGRRLFWIILAAVIALGLGIWLIPPRAVVPNVSGMTVARAENTLKKHDLQLGKQTKKINDKYPVGHIVKTQPVTGKHVHNRAKINVVVSAGPPKITIDDYTGSSFDDAKTQLLKLGMRVKEVREFSNDVKDGQVIDQDALPGNAIYKHSVVTLTVSSGPRGVGAAKQIKMPDFSNKTQAYVQDWAVSHNVTVSFADEVSNDVSQGKIIRQAPAAGSYISEGRTFTAVVSSGKALRSFHISVTVPYQDNDAHKNEIKVYLSDHDKKLKNVYQRLEITENTTLSLPFTVAAGKAGQYKIVRDGKEVMNQTRVTGY